MGELKLPFDQRELESREAAGFWKAIGLVNDLSRNKNSAINLDTLCLIHRTIFIDVAPEIAGKFRVDGQDTKKLHYITPPPGRLVYGFMVEFGKELEEKISSLSPPPKTRKQGTYRKWIHKVVTIAAWAQHKIVWIHPFSNGNGRTARLFTNLILQNNSLTGSIVKFEQEDKAAYLNALAQIDKVGDYEPLTQIILRAMQEQYKLIIKIKRNYIKGHKKSH